MAVLLLAGCTTLRFRHPLVTTDSDWLTESGTPERGRYLPAATLVPPLEQVWRFNAGAGFSAGSPLAADGKLFIPTRKGEIHVVELETGRRMGTRAFGEAIEGTPILTKDRLYIPNAWGGSVLKAYDLLRAKYLWEGRGAPIEASLLQMQDHLLAADVEGNVTAYNPDTGDVQWQYENGGLVAYATGPVQLDDQHFLVADTEGRIVVLNARTGAEGWKRHLSAPVYASPANLDGMVYIPTTQGRVVALDARTGATRWTYNAVPTLTRFSAPAVTDQYLIVGGSDGQLHALDPQTGILKWTTESDGNFSAPPLIAGEVIYVGALDRQFYALDLHTGDVLWETTLKGRVKSAALLQGDRLVVLAEPKYVYGFTMASPDS